MVVGVPGLSGMDLLWFFLETGRKAAEGGTCALERDFLSAFKKKFWGTGIGEHPELSGAMSLDRGRGEDPELPGVIS